MGETQSNSSSIWQEIEQSESYLVCSIYEEAATLASSIIRQLKGSNISDNNEAFDEIEVFDMLESAGMVFVQALNQLGRTSDILNELRVLFVSATAIPVQVLLTGACFQISGASSAGVREFLEEFLSNWSLVDGQYYVLVGAGADVGVQDGCDRRYILEVDKYMEVVEVYAVTLLGMTLKDMDSAISWVEKSALPEERQRVLLRRLHSLYSLKTINSSQVSVVSPENNPELIILRLEANYLDTREHNTKQTILKLSRRVDPCLWWFRSVNLKFGNVRVVITSGKILLGILFLLTYYVLRRKGATMNGFVRRQVSSAKKAMIDLWQLAFSYQVNPLAVVQPLPTATRGGR
ncbi:3-phosphoinositide-dependent protein [Salix suchowensis]|nr:3-phosphoinositide-dependent protein [Salix suchowensis]